MMSKPIRNSDILLVDDSKTDVMITREALELSLVSNTLHVVEDGVEAIAFLRQTGVYTDSHRPGLILLDLNLPRKDGREVLAEIKNEPDLRSIPVVVLTTSRAESDIVNSYSLHANCFVTKPLGFDEFTDAVQGIVRFWFDTVTLPKAAS